MGGERYAAAAGRRWREIRSRSRLVITATAAGIVAISVLTWALWPHPVAEPRAREYRDVTACLLTGAAGVNGSEAAPVWAGMQDASLATSAKVQYLEVDGPQTAENADGYLGSLVQSRCDLLLAVGDAPTAAMAARAAQYPDTHFVLVGAGQSRPNLSVVESDDPAVVRAAVSTLVADSVGEPTAD